MPKSMSSGSSKLDHASFNIENCEKSLRFSWGISLLKATQVKMVFHIQSIRRSLSTSFLLSSLLWRWSKYTSRAVLGGTRMNSFICTPIFFLIVSGYILTRSPERGSSSSKPATALLLLALLVLLILNKQTVNSWIHSVTTLKMTMINYG